jgi:lysophospholipase
MAKKKNSATGPAEKRLKAAVKKLRAQLAAAESQAQKWKERAKDRKSVAAGAKTELTKVRRRLAKAEASLRKWKDRPRTTASAPPAPEPAPAAPSSHPLPDDSWTVAALRAEARRRGLTGYSRKTKAELLAELRG